MKRALLSTVIVDTMKSMIGWDLTVPYGLMNLLHFVFFQVVKIPDIALELNNGEMKAYSILRIKLFVKGAQYHIPKA